jgi:hypothetical protein
MTAGYWWGGRRDGERTAVYLTRVLEALGPPFAAVATKARACHFDDYFCPPQVDDGANIHRLVAAIQKRLDRPDVDPPTRQKAVQVAVAAREGEFDGTREEAREWGRSAEGQATFALLLPKQDRERR